MTERTKPLRIALVRARYTASGGAERFVERALEALAADALELTIIARAWRGGGASNAASIRWAKCNPFYLGSTWRDWSFARAARRLVARSQFDLVQSHERIPGLDVYRAGDGVHAAWLERRARVQSRFERLGVALNVHHRYLLATERRLFEHPRLKAVICNSILVRDEISARFAIAPEKLALVPNGVDTEYFHPRLRAQRAPQRARLGLPKEAPVLLFVGSGFERKGLRAAIEVLAESAAGSVYLLIAGRDKHASQYRQLARQLGVAERVHFLGEVPDTRLLYGVADALILPTLYDPFPNVILEALACGVPVIVSDACGAVDVVRPGSNGWVVPVGDRPALVQALVTWQEATMRPPAARLLSDNARASVVEYDLAALSRRLRELYGRLLEGRAASEGPQSPPEVLPIAAAGGLEGAGGAEGAGC